jgi:alanine racemase
MTGPNPFSVSRPLRARLDFSALRHNFAVARSLAGGAKLWAVIKADAYGHGQFAAAQALAGLADGYALLESEVAVALRERGFQQPILLLEGFFAREEIERLSRHALIPVVHCQEQLAMLAAMPVPPAHVYLKLNSGMNRLGFRAEDFGAARQRLEALGIRQITLMNHFSDADTSTGIAAQLASVRQVARDAGAGLPQSLANSAALIRYPESRSGERDWARPGIMLYGGSPFGCEPGHTAADLGLRPVMTLESRLIAIQEVKPGERVGYGGTFCADTPMRIGIVACGYADGYPRHAPTGTPICAAGIRTRTLGRVSMDMLACDLTGIPQARIGSPVTLWGSGEGGAIDADAVAAAAGTISYELFCAVAPRVPRLDEKNGP